MVKKNGRRRRVRWTIQGSIHWKNSNYVFTMVENGVGRIGIARNSIKKVKMAVIYTPPHILC